MPSAPTMTSASISLPSAKRAAATSPSVRTCVHRRPSVTMPAGSAPASTARRSARWTVAPSMPNDAACCLRLVFPITRPVFQLRRTCHCDRPATARTPSSTPIARSTFIALGCRATPAPISLSSAAASYTATSIPARDRAFAAVRPPMPPPMIATRVMPGPVSCQAPCHARPLVISGERAVSPVHDGDRASALRMVAARSVVEYGAMREVHDEHVHDREAGWIEPCYVKLVMANRNGDIIFRRELRADERAFNGNALDHGFAVCLLECVSGVPAQRIGRVDHVPAEVEPCQAEAGSLRDVPRWCRGGARRYGRHGHRDRGEEPGRAQ